MQMRVSIKKIVTFIFLLNIFYLPHMAFSDSSCLEALEGLSKDELNLRLLNLLHMDAIDQLVVEPMIKHPKFDSNLTFGNENTVLHYAIDKKRTHIARLLIDLNKIELNARNEDGYTPMMLANLYDQRDIGKLIFEKLTLKQRTSYLQDILEIRNMQN